MVKYGLKLAKDLHAIYGIDPDSTASFNVQVMCSRISARASPPIAMCAERGHSP